MSVSKKQWGRTADGSEVFLYTLRNRAGLEAEISTFGAALTALKIPVKDSAVDVVLGYERFENYVTDKTYSGITVGRTANRISGASFRLDGTEYHLEKNEGENTLHGGQSGLGTRIWSADVSEDEDRPAIRLTYSSPDGEGGYPGNLLVEVIYTMFEDGLRIDYLAETDRPCPVSLTAHPYFNLKGGGNNLSGHELTIHSCNTLELDAELIPTGTITDVHGTPGDFTVPAPMDGSDPDNPAQHDRYYILDKVSGEMSVAALISCKSSGLELEISTTQPGLQFYSGDGIEPGTVGKKGCVYGPRAGFCIEPHGYPDAPNRKEFPSVILHPGATYMHSTEYRFRHI
ncbi:aldose epimerase family protein [Maridesulfovibrio sp. FT414]|uniref:aldose epimerase family protein n=1 Tax=Maridesulfovibrio sp. FT414 TaxID=2979469 RepID=UPI003D803B20